MSTNPYAAPKAHVSDETIVLRSNFLAPGRSVAAGNGWTWIGDAWSLFRAAPGTWIAMVLVAVVIFVVLAFIEFIGTIASFVLGPVFTAGLVMASRTVQQGGNMEFGQLFAGFRHRFGMLAAVGVLYLAGTVVIVFLTSTLTGVDMFGVFRGTMTPEEMAQLGLKLAIALLVVSGLMLPLVMAIWFAPPLVVFHDMGAGAAMKASFIGCLKNILPFLVYGVVMLIASVIASIPLMLGWLVLGPVIVASVYTAYRDIYFSPEG